MTIISNYEELDVIVAAEGLPSPHHDVPPAQAPGAGLASSPTAGTRPPRSAMRRA